MPGRNIRFIKDTIGYEDIFQLSCRDLKEELIFKKIPPEEKWKVSLVRVLTDVRRGTFALGDESTDDDAKQSSLPYERGPIRPGMSNPSFCRLGRCRKFVLTFDGVSQY